jgi:CheY-like chemotaxis protein
MAELTVLLVEDNADDLFLTLRALRQTGLPLLVDTVGDGVEALDYLCGRLAQPAALPGLVLLDLQIPRFNGLEFLAQLRDNPALSEIPVVALTASDNPRDQLRSRELGVIAYLLKPLVPAAIIDIVTSHHLL